MPLLAPVQGEDAIGVSPNEVHRKLCCIDESEMLFLLFRIARGFAFSGDEGMDKLVTDNLTNRLKDAINRQMFGNMFETQQNDTI